MTKREMEEREAQARAGIERANEILRGKHAVACVEYAKTNIILQIGPEATLKVAKTLSKKYPNMSFGVVLVDGKGSLKMEPLFTQFDTKANYLDQIEKDAAKAAIQPDFWPEPSVVRAFAEGHEAGSGSQEIEELRREVARLKEKPSFPGFPMGPWSLYGPRF